ncbi:MAG: helix-turn-helix domain-containing protein, partial [Gemmataceae bacterium]|nr:helix-turn-helix domain-containing protein [Gemmataceae bacterium]
MAQTYTLEEAAERLGVTPEEMKRRLKEDWKTLRAFRDGPTLRFRSTEIEELARSLGAASDPGLPLAPMDSHDPPGSDDFKIAPSSTDEPLVFGTPDEDIFALSTDEPPPPAGAKKPDSDVRLEGKPKSKPPKKEGDSDVRLEPAKPKSGKDAAVVPTEEIALDFSGPGSAVIKGGSSAKLSAPKSSAKLTGGDSGKSLANKPGTGDSSEFELSLDSDSDDFEIQLNTDSSDEVDLGSLPKAKGGSGRKGGESGINLRDPADSGISLEKKGKSKPPADPAEHDRLVRDLEREVQELSDREAKLRAEADA